MEGESNERPTPQQAPAGWYSDPTNPEALRLWDGTQWTALTRTAGDPAGFPPVGGEVGTTPPVAGTAAGDADDSTSWWSNRRAQVGMVVAVALLAVTAAVTIGGGGSDDGTGEQAEPADSPEVPVDTTTSTTTTTTTEAPRPADSREITTPDGYRYLVEVEVEGPDPMGTDSVDTDSLNPIACIPTAPPGETNMWFTVSVTNMLDDRDATPPLLTVDTNLTQSHDAGEKRVLSVEDRLAADFYTEDLAFTGNDPTFRCDNTTWRPFGERMGANSTIEITGVLGPLTDPVPDGVVLLITGAGISEPWVVPLTEPA
jgi:hypothetical protein